MSEPSEILRALIVVQHGFPTSWYLILDCGHWYHWTGSPAPDSKTFLCPNCEPPLTVVKGTETPSV
jgi:hypothetical protein